MSTILHHVKDIVNYIDVVESFLKENNQTQEFDKLLTILSQCKQAKNIKSFLFEFPNFINALSKHNHKSKLISRFD